MKLTRIHRKLMASAAAIAAAVLTSTPARADDLTTLITRWKTFVASVPSFINDVVMVLGMLGVAFGLYELWQHYKNPQRVEMKGAIAGIVIGGCLLSWVAYASFIQNQNTGGGSQTIAVQTVPTLN